MLALAASLENLLKWYDSYREHVSATGGTSLGLPLVVSNKSDLFYADAEAMAAQGGGLAEQVQGRFFQTSAASKEGVTEPFQYIADHVVRTYEERKADLAAMVH